MYNSLEAESSKDSSPPSLPTKVTLRGTQRFATVFKEKRGLQPSFVNVLPSLSRYGAWCEMGPRKFVSRQNSSLITPLTISSTFHTKREIITMIAIQSKPFCNLTSLNFVTFCCTASINWPALGNFAVGNFDVAIFAVSEFRRKEISP